MKKILLPLLSLSAGVAFAGGSSDLDTSLEIGRLKERVRNLEQERVTQLEQYRYSAKHQYMDSATRLLEACLTTSHGYSRDEKFCEQLKYSFLNTVIIKDTPNA